jgi:CHAT domain-containing protein
VQKYSCSYAASATLWTDQQQDPFEQKQLECLGIAWGKDGITSLGGKQTRINGLKETESELKVLRGITAGKFFVGKDASEAIFKQNAPYYSILHLALHARVTEADPQILFPNSGSPKEDGILHFHELFQLHLNARLAVLSACETGSGKLIKGEGIQSISSGFAAVGVPSLIISLWELDDAAGSEVMKGFYDGVQAGNPLDQALQQSKLAYLQNATGDKCAPYYWSAFVPMGNMKPIQLSPPFNVNWWLAGLVLTVSLCIFAIYRIFIRKNKFA